MIDQRILQSFITSIKTAIKNKSIDTSSAMKLIVISMEIIENMENVDVNNIDKKQYVIIHLLALFLILGLLVGSILNFLAFLLSILVLIKNN
jgi:hypothetical protein